MVPDEPGGDVLEAPVRQVARVVIDDVGVVVLGGDLVVEGVVAVGHVRLGQR